MISRNQRLLFRVFILTYKLKFRIDLQKLNLLFYFLNFFLDKKVTKNQDEKMLQPTLLVLFIF